MLRKIIFSLIAAAAMFSSTAFAAVGDIAGSYYYTDIVTYIYHSPITSYNIGGETVIDAEALNWHFGFDVYWRPESRVLEILDKGGSFNSLEAMNGSCAEKADGRVGEKAGDFYQTDIVATVDGREIKSYNIGGRTCISAEQLRDFGYNVSWDADARTLTVTKPADFYKIETDFGTIATDINYSAPKRHFGTWSEGVSFTNDAGTVTAKSICTASSESYIKLADLCRILGAECSLETEQKMSHTEWVNGVSYDEPYYVYNFVINLDDSGYKCSRDLLNGDFAELEADCYAVAYNVYATVNGERVEFESPHFGRNGVSMYNTGICVVNSEVYVPTYFASVLTGTAELENN